MSAPYEALMVPKYLGHTDTHEDVLRDRKYTAADIAITFDKETLKELAESNDPEPVPKRFSSDEPNQLGKLGNRYYMEL
jgi:hypothetical protein